MTLTKVQKRKLAKAARELASEYAEGRGPELIPTSYCGCGAAAVVRRAAVLPPATRRFRIANFAYAIDRLLLDTEWAYIGLVSQGTSQQTTHGVPGAVVFPLLALADELEA